MIKWHVIAHGSISTPLDTSYAKELTSSSRWGILNDVDSEAQRLENKQADGSPTMGTLDADRRGKFPSPRGAHAHYPYLACRVDKTTIVDKLRHGRVASRPEPRNSTRERGEREREREREGECVCVCVWRRWLRFYRGMGNRAMSGYTGRHLG